MPKIVPLKSNELIKKLQLLGFQGPIPGGKHIHMIKGSITIPVPVHGGKDIGVGLIAKIIKQSGTTSEERNNL